MRKLSISFRYNIKRYFDFVRPYRWLFVFSLLLVFITEALTFVNKYLLKVLIDYGTEYSNNLIVKEKFVYILFILLAVFTSTLVFRTITRWFGHKFSNILQCNTIADLKRYYFNRILNLSHNFHNTNRAGSLISKIGRGARAIDDFTDFILENLVILLTQIVMIVISFLYFDPILILILIITLILFILYSINVQNKQRNVNFQYNECEDLEKGYVGDVLTNVDSIKYFGKENYIKNKFKFIAKNTSDKFYQYLVYFRYIVAGQSIISSIGLFFTMYFSIRSFLNGVISIGTVAFIYTAYLGFSEAMWGFMRGVKRYYRSMTDLDSVFKYDFVKSEVQDVSNAHELKIKNGQIEFKKITFKYHNRIIIKDLNLTIKPGEKVAFVGHSGSGKTTIIKLLYRLFDLNKGEILIDGINIKNVKQESLRSELSIVPQECILFNDTIYNNILFAEPSATNHEVMKAIKFAQLDKVINNFLNKEKTIVGERGVKLSGGEKQRVSIARALLANKKVIILDEATSSLDSQTEHDLQKDLESLLKNRTAIIIAHRLSTIMNVDKIVVFDKGNIVQTGKHRNLILQQGHYKKLWNLQKGGYIKE